MNTEMANFANQALAYLRVTAAQGPSQQLIDFINRDKSFGSEIGLEGFETMPTDAQHAVMKLKFTKALEDLGVDPETTDEVEAEGEGTITAEGDETFKDEQPAVVTEDEGVVTTDQVDLPNSDGAK